MTLTHNVEKKWCLKRMNRSKTFLSIEYSHFACNMHITQPGDFYFFYGVSGVGHEQRLKKSCLYMIRLLYMLRQLTCNGNTLYHVVM